MFGGVDGGGSVDGAGTGGERSGALVSRDGPASNIRTTTSTLVSMCCEQGNDAGRDRAIITTVTASTMWSRAEAITAQRKQFRVERKPGIM